MYQGNKLMIQSSSAAAAGTMWTREEDEQLAKALAEFPDGTEGRWKKIADVIPGKTEEQVIVHFSELLHYMVAIHKGEIKPPISIQQHNHDEHVEKGRSKHGGGGERNKGTSWTEEEHMKFLKGLEKYGRGNWRDISRFAVMTRTPTQVASHAQKYFLRHSSSNSNKRRRASIHDITITPTPTVALPPPPVLTNNGSFHGVASGGAPPQEGTPIVTQPPQVVTNSGSFHGAASGGVPPQENTPIVAQPPPPPPVVTNYGSFHGAASGGAPLQQWTPIVAQPPPTPLVTNCSIHDITIIPTPIVAQPPPPPPPVVANSCIFHEAGSGGAPPQQGTLIVAQPPPPPTPMTNNWSFHVEGGGAPEAWYGDPQDFWYPDFYYDTYF